ncbi:MAG: hypothetical protein O3A95_06180 [Planctomycetota bacterium]|nr:hypothetical protein [Planctomycetota bacterium]MDA1113870.1 hypothetical protein [Planctomycetota bacterium]
MRLQQRVRRRVWLLRSGQCLLAAIAGGVGFGLVAVAEGRTPLPLAICGAVLLGCLVLVVSKPWGSASQAIDPEQDVDGLLRTVLSQELEQGVAEKLEQEAGHRPLALRRLPDWPAWGVLLALASAGAGWVLLEPEAAARAVPLGQGDLVGLALDGRPTEQSALAALAEQNESRDLAELSSQSEDGEDGSEQGQWQRAKLAEGASALRLSLDLGVEQRVYERYLQNRAKHP